MAYNEIKFKRYADESFYLDLNKARKRKKFLTMVVSARRMGKTFSATMIVIDDYIKKGYHSIWLRRFLPQVKKDLEETGWWGKCIDQYCKDNHLEQVDDEGNPKYVGTVDGNQFMIDDEIVMTMGSLTEAVAMKGHERLGIANLIFDEFIEKNRWNYIPPAENEPSQYLLKCASTFLRDDNIPAEDRHIYLLSNAESLANPYFNEFDLIDQIQEDTEWLISDDIALWLPRMSLALKKKLMEEPLYRVIGKSSYAKVAIENTFFDGGNLNIQATLKPASKQLFSLQIYNVHFYVYSQSDNGEDYIYISQTGAPGKKQFVLNIKSIANEHERVIPQMALKNLQDSLGANIVKFDSIKTRNIFIDSIKSRYS